MNLDAVPDTLRALPRWVLWRTVARNGKPTKQPLTAAGRAASSTDPGTWTTFDVVTGVRDIPGIDVSTFHGVGVVLGDVGNGMHLCGIDLDSCVEAGGAIVAWAQPVVDALDTYREFSPSDTGVKGFFWATAADAASVRALFGIAASKWGSKRSVAGVNNGAEHGPAIEVYLGPGRYFAVTGRAFGIVRDKVSVFDHAMLERIATLIDVVAARSAKSGQAPRKSRKGRDKTRSAEAFRIAVRLTALGASYDEVREAIRTNPKTAGWYHEKGEPDDERELKNIWRNAGGEARDAGNAPGTKPVIRVVDGALDRLADDIEAVLVAAGAEIYQRGDGLTRPALIPLPTAGGRIVMSAALVRLGVYHLLDIFCRYARWVKWDGRARAFVATDPPKDVAQVLLSRVGLWRVPAVRGIITTPTLRPDGSVLSTPGYDAASGFYLHLATCFVMPEIPEEPTKAEAQESLARLTSLLDEFPFVAAVDRAVVLSAIITAVVRAAMTVAPMHAATAPAPRTGKSYAWDIVCVIATGEPACPVLAVADDPTEFIKKLTGNLLDGVPVFSIDNLEQSIGGDLMCQAAERPILDLRRLGRSDAIKVPNSVTLLATGNNLTVRGDLVWRTAMTRMDAQMENPGERTFAHTTPVARVLENRGQFVADVLTIVHAALCAVDLPDLYPVAGYEDWTRFVRTPLVWLGCADPATSMRGLQDEDPVTTTLHAVMDAWLPMHPFDEEVLITDLARQVAAGAAPERLRDSSVKPEQVALAEAFVLACGGKTHADVRGIGRWLRRMEGRIAKGRQFVRRTGHAGFTWWRLTTPKQPSV